MKIGFFTLLCALIMFSQLLQAECGRQKEGGKERTNPGKDGKKQTGSNNHNGRGQKIQGQRGSPKGNFINKEKFVCTWTVNEAERATLKIDCKKEGNTMSCEFWGNPSSCSQYPENKKTFWKQIIRSLKKKKNVCEDSNNILKSKVCNKSAHLRLITRKPEEKSIFHEKEASPTPATPAATNKQLEKAPLECVEDIDYIDQSKVAEEHCSELFLSFCKFFISMIQDKKC